MSAAKIHPGVVMLFIDENGRVIAEAADFLAETYGGYSLAEGQRKRARDELACKVVDAYASPQLTRALSQYDKNDLLSCLVRDHRCKVHEVRVGHDDA